MNIKQRLAKLEACKKKQQTLRLDREAEITAMNEESEREWWALIERMRGCEAHAGMSVMQQIACLWWKDPDAALRWLAAEDAAYQQELEQDPWYRQWRYGEEMGVR